MREGVQGCRAGWRGEELSPLTHSEVITSFPGSPSVQGVSEVTDDIMVGGEEEEMLR